MDDIKKALDRLLEKQEETHQRISEIDKTLLRNTITLEEHIKRTNLLEEQVKKIDNEIAPIQAHVVQIQGAGNLIKWLGVIGGAIMAIAAVYKLLS